MSVVVRMEMPKGNCQLAVEIPYVGDWCPILAKTCDYSMTKKMPKDCPIICQLPEGHGTLIDLETAAEGLSERFNSCHMTCGAVMQFLDGLPTIVPAEAERSET